jgi:ubiquinone/menaquinone biosynthesis C-methylase UbiE
VRSNAIAYWDKAAKARDPDTRDAILAGFRTERSFDEAGREDASHLILPFITQKDSVLDIGCGIARLLKWVAPHCRRAYGFDVSKEMLRKARDRCRDFKHVQFRRLPMSLRVPLDNGTIDFAFFYHVSEHLEREDLFVLLKEMRRVLRSGGCALVQFSLLDHQDNQREFRRWTINDDHEGVRSRFYTEAEAALILRMVGFHPQIRLYIPGEFSVIVTKTDRRELGAMPLVKLRHAGEPLKRRLS